MYPISHMWGADDYMSFECTGCSTAEKNPSHHESVCVPSLTLAVLWSHCVPLQSWQLFLKLWSGVLKCGESGELSHPSRLSLPVQSCYKYGSSTVPAGELLQELVSSKRQRLWWVFSFSRHGVSHTIGSQRTVWWTVILAESSTAASNNICPVLVLCGENAST